MHRVRFCDPAGSVRTGEWTDEGIVFDGRTYAPESVEILPPCEPTKVVCVGRNYAKHAAETNSEIPDRPLLFLKPPNALSAHGDTVPLPAGKERVEHEAELAVVIGEQCRNVPEEEAMEYVAGFTCLDDVSNRDDQRIERNWVRGKAFDNSCPIGPVLATPEEVPEDARISLRVNGETRQDSTLSRFIFTVPELIAEITSYMTLEAGDVVSTGTPEGVAPLSDGDRVEVDIEGIRTLEHTVRRD
ncbi:fumarylacetoacetate hydrolase family protein [Halopenitus salinus]|uniref:Fumarylacetoacetate hydrolase family protein n=1 Tax=Halopenitus salinus TaxID=1198295 RepID=A0ABD5UUV1_9EURY